MSQTDRPSGDLGSFQAADFIFREGSSQENGEKSDFLCFYNSAVLHQH